MNLCGLVQKKGSEQPICGQLPVQRMKILGVWYSAAVNCTPYNFEALEERVKVTLNQWSERALTIKGKITVAKSLIVSQMVYIVAVTRFDEKQLAVIQSHIMRFLWRGRPPKVARSTITMPVGKGGLNVPELQLLNKAWRIAWLGKMVQNKEAIFVKVLQNRLHIAIDKISGIDFDGQWVANRQIPDFYKDMFKWYKTICPATAPQSGKNIRKQHIWHNTALKVGNKTLCSRRLADMGITLLDDMVDATGAIERYHAFTNRHNVRINPLLYMGWCRAIPARWKQLLSSSLPLTAEERNAVPTISLNEKDIPINIVRPNVWYQTMTPERVPTAQLRWVAEGVDFRLDWSQVFALPFRVTTSTRLQSLQYRITHRYFPTRRFLFTRAIIDDPFL